MDEKASKILDAMRKADGPVRPSDVAEMTGIDRKEVSKIIGDLKKEGVVISPKRCYYTMKE